MDYSGGFLSIILQVLVGVSEVRNGDARNKKPPVSHGVINLKSDVVLRQNTPF